MSRCASFVPRVPVCVDTCVSSSGLLLGVSGDFRSFGRFVVAKLI